MSLTPSLPLGLSRRAEWASRQAISYLMAQAVENPGVLSLAAGLVDEQTLPVELCRSLTSDVLRDDRNARAALQYGTTPGAERLRQAICGHLARLEQRTPSELRVESGQIVLTAGSQQLLSLVADILLDPGDICFVAVPTYFVFLGVLNGVGARSIPIPADEHGMKVELLEAALKDVEERGELDRVKLVYVVSEFENPSGCCLSLERRKHLLEVVRHYSRRQRIHILEDAAYRELRYSGSDIPSLWGLDDDRRTVILAHTFSKSFSPGIRVGYGVLPDGLVGAICNRKGNQDFGSPHFNQMVIATAMETGQYVRHVEHVRHGYSKKLAVFLRALETEFRDLPEVSWIRPEGGLYVWMSLPEQIPTSFDSPMFKACVQDHQVMYVPGELGYPETSNGTRQTHQMRLSFGMLDEAGLQEGARRLAAAAKQILSDPRKPPDRK